MTNNKWRKLKAPHSITCTDCGEPATHGNSWEWEASGRKGISFFYHCRKHANMRKKGSLPWKQ